MLPQRRRSWKLHLTWNPETLPFLQRNKSSNKKRLKKRNMNRLKRYSNKRMRVKLKKPLNKRKSLNQIR